MPPEKFVLDVSRLTPEARSVVHKAAAVYVEHTAAWFIGLMAHGSAVKRLLTWR